MDSLVSAVDLISAIEASSAEIRLSCLASTWEEVCRSAGWVLLPTMRVVGVTGADHAIFLGVVGTAASFAADLSAFLLPVANLGVWEPR